MALTEKLAILITGDASGAISEMKKLAAESEKNLGKTGADVSNFSKQATKIGAGMVGVGTGLLAVGLSAASTTTDLGKEVIKLQRYTGMNAESASKLAYAAKMSGVDVDSLAVGIGKLSKTMATTPDKLTKMGVEAKTSDGHLRSMTDVLGDVADKFKKMGPGTESTAAALELFGRSGANLLPFLLKGKDGIGELSAEAEKMGLVLSQDNIDAVKKNIVAQRQLTAAVNGAKVQIGNEMLPILTKFTETMTGLPGPIKDVIGPVVVFGGAALVTGGMVLLMAGQVQRAKAAYAEMSATAQTSIGVLGMVAAAATVGIAAYSSMQGAVDRAKGSQDKMNRSMETAAASSGWSALQEQMRRTTAENKKLYDGLSLPRLIRWDPWNAFGEVGKMKAADESVQRMHLISAAAIAMSDKFGMSHDAATIWLGKMAESGTVFPTVQAALDAYTGRVDANKVGTEEAATAQDGYAASIKHAADVLRGTTDPIFAVMTAQDSLTQAQAEYDKIKNDGTKTDAEKEQALRKLWQASWDLTDAQTKLGGALATGEVSGPKLQAALDTLRLNGIDPTTEAGRALSEKILGVDETARVVSALLKGRVLKVETDETNLDSMNRKLAQARIDLDWMLVHDVGTKGNGLGFRLPQSETRASGGFIPQGRMTLVGEHGPELFIPSSSGTVMTSLSTAHAMSGGSGDGVTIQQLHVSLPNVTNGDQLVDELQRYVRRNGPLPLAVAG